MSTRIVLIHHTVPDYQKFIDGLKSDVCPVFYNEVDGDISELLLHITPSITHLALVYDFPGFYSIPMFPDIDYETRDASSSKYKYISNTFINILDTIKKTISTKLTVDLLSCRLNSPIFQSEIQSLEKELDINIRYSVNDTGRRPKGDWILESHGVDIKDEYFTESIDLWNHVLNSAIPSTDLTTIGDIGTFILDGGVYKLTKNITWDTTLSGVAAITDYIELGIGEIFDGQGYTIVIPGTTTGLFAGSLSISSYPDRFIIRNLNIICNVGQYGGGFIRGEQPFFSIEGCKHMGRIGSSSVFFAGGIVGNRGGWNGGQADVCDCHSYGDIGRACGGIVGDEFCYSGTGTIQRCSSVGGNTYNQDNGGIVGTFTGYNGGNVTIEDCISTIGLGNNTGGITATRTGDTNGTVVIRRCSHQGVFFASQINGGGIVGGFAGARGGYVEITDCFSTGKIYNAGGIAGAGAAESGSLLIKNCYTLGNIVGNNSSFGAGGIVGFRPARFSGKLQIVNSYAVGVVYGSQTAKCGTIVGDSAVLSPSGDAGIRIFNTYGNGTHRVVGNNATTGRIKHDNTSLTTLGATYVGLSMETIVGEIDTGLQYQDTIAGDNTLIETTIDPFDTANTWAENLGDISETIRYCLHSVNKDAIVVLPEYSDVASLSFWVSLAFSDGNNAKVIDLRTSTSLNDLDYLDSISGYDGGFTKLYINGIEEPYASPFRMSYASITRHNWAHIHLVLKKKKSVKATLLGAYNNTQKIDGAVRDIVLWKGELTPKEVYEHYYYDKGLIIDNADSRVAAYYTLNNVLTPTIGSNGSAVITGTQHFCPTYIGSGFPRLVNFMETINTRGWQQGSYASIDDFPVLTPSHSVSTAVNGVYLLDGSSNSYYTYKKKIFLKHSKGATANSYPINVELRYRTGVDYGNVIYLNEHCDPTFKDVRFGPEGDETVEYPHWIEDKVDEAYAKVWFNATDIDLGTSDSGIHIYYGNTDVSWNVSGEGVFSHFTDFNTNNNIWISGTSDVSSTKPLFLNVGSTYGTDTSYFTLTNVSGFVIRNVAQAQEAIPGSGSLFVNYLAVGEIRAYDTLDTNVIQTETVSGSSLSVYTSNNTLYGSQRAYDNSNSTFYHSNGTGTNEFLRVNFVNNRQTLKSMEVAERGDDSTLTVRSRYETVDVVDSSDNILFRTERRGNNIESINFGDYPSTMLLQTTNTSSGLATATNTSYIIGNHSIRYKTRDCLRSRTVTKVIARGNQSQNKGVGWKKDRVTSTNAEQYSLITSPFTYGGGGTGSNTITEIGGSERWLTRELQCYDRYYRGRGVLEASIVDYLDTGATPTLSGYLYLQNERGPYLEFDWIAVRNYIPFEPIIAGTSIEYEKTIESPPVGNSNPTRFYIPINYLRMQSIIDVFTPSQTAYMNIPNLKNIIMDTFNSVSGASDELTPEDIELSDYTFPVSLTTLLDDIKTVIHSEIYEDILNKYKADIFDVSEDYTGGNIPVMLKVVKKNLSSIENRNVLLFEGDPSNTLTESEISLDTTGAPNLYSRLNIDGQIVDNAFIAEPGYAIGIVININSSGNINLQYVDNSIPITGKTLTSEKNSSEILTNDEFPIGKVKYNVDSTGIVLDGNGGLNVNVVLISCGGDRGISV